MIDEIDFSKAYEYVVQVYHETLGDFGEAKLKFGANKMAYVHFKNAFANRRVAEGKVYDVLKARAESGEYFTLFKCKFWGFVLHADFVVDGDVEDAFNTIEIRYSDISEWFTRWQHLDGELGKEIKWVNIPQQISVVVHTKDEHFSLKTETVGHSEKIGEDYIIHEHIAFIFEKMIQEFRIVDVKSKASELSNLLSILVACPISIVSVRVTGIDRRPYSVYFGAFKKAESDSSRDGFSNKYLASKEDIDGKWPTLIQRYYESKYRKISWVRLSGMQRYEGFWEYKTLGYVSLLDKYVSQTSLGHLRPTIPAKKKLSQLSRAIKKTKNALSDDQHDEVMALVAKYFSGERKLYFSEQFDYAIGKSDPDIIKVINISKKDFMYIKEVRDAIAHGDAIDFLGNDLTRVSSIIDKIALLLTYFAFVDFGLSADDFKKCLRGNLNRLSLNPGLNKMHLARITNTAAFYDVSKKQFDKISKLKNSKISLCFTRGPRGSIKYSEKYTEMSEQWFRGHHKKSGQSTFEDLFGVSKGQVISSGATYIEHGEEYLALHQAYVISSA